MGIKSSLAKKLKKANKTWKKAQTRSKTEKRRPAGLNEYFPKSRVPQASNPGSGTYPTIHGCHAANQKQPAAAVPYATGHRSRAPLQWQQSTPYKKRPDHKRNKR